jgi:hypothetical protein
MQQAALVQALSVIRWKNSLALFFIFFFIREDRRRDRIKIQKQKELCVLLLRFELRILHSKCRVITTSL